MAFRRWLCAAVTLAVLAARCAMGAEPIVPAGAVPATTAPDRKSLFTFDSAFDPKLIKESGGKAAVAPNDALRITTPANAFWPGVVVNAPVDAGGHWDLSPYAYVSVDIHNIDTHDIDVFVNVNNPGFDGTSHCIGERAGVAPDQRVTLTIPLRRVSSSPIKLFGMAGYPQGLYPGNKGLDVSNIISITIFTSRGTPTANVFEISNVYAGGQYIVPAWGTMTEKEFFPFIDKFGQFKHAEWPGKTHSVDDMTQAREAEAKTLAGDPGPKSWDKWGGWANGPQLEATGHFRVAKHNAKWWLVDPDGRLFFSTGITCVGYGGGPTVVEERANWFEDLPANEGDAKPFYSKSYKVWSGYYSGKEPMMFNFTKRNIIAKYGPDWTKTYPETIHQRLRAWGINTIANWSDAGVYKLQRTPYTGVFFYSCRHLKNAGSGFPDVFDPKFAPALAAGAKQFLSGTTDDPWCIGYFCDNEMPWGGETTLAQDTLKSPADQPAKIEMARWLKDRYPDIADLNKAWGTSLASYDAFLADTKIAPQTSAATGDLTAFTDRIAEVYFKTVKDTLKQLAPHKLYLGCRCVGGSINVIASAIKYCDVVSYNRYCHSVKEVRFPGDLDGPMLIGEFHFGALDRGLFGTGLVSADNQAQRAKCYADYVNSALDNSQMVGVHWFQYGDSPTAGRADGENHQIGFIDACDLPYAETTASARATAERMYERRAALK